jgi:hypothetical protein
VVTIIYPTFTISNQNNMTQTTIYTNREETLIAHTFIIANRKTAYIRSNAATNYYNVNGVIWEWWQEGTGTYPTTEGICYHDFIQRTCKQVYDFRNEATNERKSVYEVSEFRHYTLIHKQYGEVVAIHHAENGLTLVLKHFNN